MKEKTYYGILPENASGLNYEQYFELVLLVRDTILELEACGAEKEGIDKLTKIFNVLTKNDVDGLLKDFRG